MTGHGGCELGSLAAATHLLEGVRNSEELRKGMQQQLCS